ncbi:MULTISPECIES: carbon-nitrogen hydrolase family protein [unclassified Massilia]|uniref:carbon-nitrogen hydrolase family protein n=1 Tax=unclassified Massilia TaxID=2609279 RepID=UPI001B824059|nr:MULTISPECIES: carbon-nitrogen hydrolase family protein [unclassified Massilia]MBQ5939224.1 carbon-nitrogen hydrolase family protein [Massilia sp. AB1]MBQ5965597.1 carbon-nitrogen hydrolase family protein [Massilia sp. ZL223]
MTKPVFAAAQCSVRAGDLAENIQRHLVFMHAARRHGVRFLVFPELSLTGYEPALADALAQQEDTALLEPLRSLAQDAAMTTVVGLPLRSAAHDKPLVAAFILHADGNMTVHVKQHLHTGEEMYFSPGDGGPMLEVSGIPTALSICADFGQPSHAEAAAAAGAQVYAASVLIGEGGYPTDSTILRGYAEQHRMAVLLANHGGPTGGWTSAGRSAFWDERGALVAAASGAGDQLLLVSRGNMGWVGSTVSVEVGVPSEEAGLAP